MEKFRNLVLEANKTLRLADHMLYVTYPLMKDNKLLIHIVKNIDNSLKSSIDAFIRYDLVYKRIRADPQSFVEKLHIFSKISSQRYGFKQEDFEFIEEVRELIEKHKKSPIEFVRGNKLIITYSNFKTKILTVDSVKDIISKAKPFIVKLNNILKKDELLTRRKR